MIRNYKANKDIYFHDSLVAKKGEVLLLLDDTLCNTNRDIRISNIGKWWQDIFDKSLDLVQVDTTDDNVNHPKHYTSHPSGIECIEITRHYCFAIGNAIKYLWRAGLKKDSSLEDRQKEIEDLEKAIWYIKDRIKQLKNGKVNNP